MYFLHVRTGLLIMTWFLPHAHGTESIATDKVQKHLAFKTVNTPPTRWYPSIEQVDRNSHCRNFKLRMGRTASFWKIDIIPRGARAEGPSVARLSNAPHKNYSNLHCSAALALSHIERL